jgi:hypothetical protein
MSAFVITDMGFAQHVLDLVAVADEFAEADMLWQAMLKADDEVVKFADENLWDEQDSRWQYHDAWYDMARDRYRRAVNELHDVARGQ